jgi:hypothetical protein
MVFFWHSHNGQTILAVRDSDGSEHFIYQCFTHQDPRVNFLIPSAKIFASAIQNVQYPQPPYSPQQKQSGFHIRPILTPETLQLEPIIFTSAPNFDGQGFAPTNFDYAARDRLGEVGTRQIRYLKIQLYRAVDKNLKLGTDLSQSINSVHDKVIWGFVIQPKTTSVGLPDPPGYGP